MSDTEKPKQQDSNFLPGFLVGVATIFVGGILLEQFREARRERRMQRQLDQLEEAAPFEAWM